MISFVKKEKLIKSQRIFGFLCDFLGYDEYRFTYESILIISSNRSILWILLEQIIHFR